jgi:hypothetical protein
VVDEWQVTVLGPPELTVAQTERLRRQVSNALELLSVQLAEIVPAVSVAVSHSGG